ncbi:MAG: hypothetical protein R2911_33135 [Caldilineaceae bacterium]
MAPFSAHSAAQFEPAAAIMQEDFEGNWPNAAGMMKIGVLVTMVNSSGENATVIPAPALLPAGPPAPARKAAGAPVQIIIPTISIPGPSMVHST